MVQSSKRGIGTHSATPHPRALSSWDCHGRPRSVRSAGDVQHQQIREKFMKRFALAAGAAVLGLSALSACGAGNGASADAQNTQNATTPMSPSYSAGSSGGTQLATADAGALGKIVVDGAGRTLYVFDKDSTNPSKSNCDGDCAANWPPVPAGTDAP